MRSSSIKGHSLNKPHEEKKNKMLCDYVSVSLRVFSAAFAPLVVKCTQQRTIPAAKGWTFWSHCVIVH